MKIIEKPHTDLLPDLWLLSYNKKFENSVISTWVGVPQKLTWKQPFCFCDYKEKRRWNAVLSVDPGVEKLKMISNDLGRTQKSEFSVLDRKYLFGKIWSKKSKLSVYAKIWYLLIWSQLSKFFKVKFCTMSNSNIQNSVAMFTFFF